MWLRSFVVFHSLFSTTFGQPKISSSSGTLHKPNPPFANTTFIDRSSQASPTSTRTFLPTTNNELSDLTSISTSTRSQTPASSALTDNGKSSASVSSSTPSPSSAAGPTPPITSNQRTTSSNDAPPPVITSFDLAILTVTSIDPSVSENTAISTSDGTHPPGLYPFIRGGPKCFFCPPGTDNGGFFLWGMNKPGVYPPPVPPPVPNVPWPTITIGPGNKPTPGPKPDSEDPEDPQESQKSKQESQKSTQTSQKSTGCSTTTASSCAVSCATPSGKSTESCTTTTCKTTSGCSVTNTVSTTTKSGSCSPTNWAELQDNVEDSTKPNGGEDGPSPSYGGSVPAWVTAWPSETGAASSKASSKGGSVTGTSGRVSATSSDGRASVTSSAQHNFCVPYQNPSKGESYCTCDDGSSRSFLDEKASCPTTSQASGVIPTPTPIAPKTDSNGNVWNSTDIVAGTIWGCKATEVRNDLAPVPITKCLSSSSIGMAFTPTPASAKPTPTSTPPAPTPTPSQPSEPKKECDACASDMGASSCPANDPGCLVEECKQNKQCKACGQDCSKFGSGDLGGRDLISGRAITSARLTQVSKKLARRSGLRSAAHVRPRSIRKRVAHKPAWIKYAPKGWKLYKMLQDKPMEDTTEPKMCELDDYFEVRKGKVQLPRGKKPILEKMGVTPSTSYFPLVAAGPKEGKAKSGEGENIADFQLTISAEQGVFFANAIDRGEKKDSSGKVTQKGIPYQLSTVSWWAWKHTVMQGKDSKEEDTDFSNFKYSAQYNIDNPETSEIIEEAIGSSNEPKEFTPKDESEDNAFWALLGSPNGNGIAWFLADHKKSLKGKGIEKITVWFDDEEQYHLWATIK